jgi:hypothetical protein
MLIQSGFSDEVINPGGYVLELQDGTGTVLSATSFFAAFTDVEGQHLDRVTFNLRLPFDPAVCRIVLKRGGQVWTPSPPRRIRPRSR